MVQDRVRYCILKWLRGEIYFERGVFLNQRISELKQNFSLEFFEQVFDSILNDCDFCQFLNRWSLLRVLGEQPIDNVL